MSEIDEPKEQKPAGDSVKDVPKEEVEKLKAEMESYKELAQKSKEDADSYALALEQAVSETDILKKQIAEQSQIVAEEGAKIEQADIIHPAVVKNLEKMQEKLAKLESSLATAQTKISAYEEKETKKAKEETKKQSENKILSYLDKEFGAEHRNEAVKLANELVDSRKKEQPKDYAEALILLRDCYKEIAAKETPKEEKLPADSGQAGMPFLHTARKTGTVDDVLDDMKKDGSWKT